MPVPPDHYPPGWRLFSAQIRFGRAHGQCECAGACGLHGGKNAGRRCQELHHTPARFAKGLVRLTVAHLCSCKPICMTPSHVLAACQRCHLRIDRYTHARHRLEHQRAAREILPLSDHFPPGPP